MKHLAALAALAVAAALPAHALSMGDLAFTFFNADEDGFSLVTFVDIAAGTTIHFSDNEWNGTSFNTGEGTFTWNTGPAVIAAGAVVRFSTVDTDEQASLGTLAGAGDNGINATSETIYAYLGTSVSQPTTFLAGVSSEGSTNLTPAGLTPGTTAIVLTNSTDHAQYTGPRSGLASLAEYRTLVNSAANWSIVTDGNNAAAVANTTAFTVTAVPETGSWAMLLAGFGAVGVVGRRRAR